MTGEGEFEDRRGGTGEAVGEETSRGMGTLPEQAAKPSPVIIKNTGRNLSLNLILNFQLHLPDRFQQRPTLFKSGFAQVAHPEVDATAAAA